MMTFTPPMVSSVMEIRCEFISCTFCERLRNRRERPATTSATSGSMQSTKRVSLTLRYTSMARYSTMVMTDDSNACTEPRMLSSYSIMSLLNRDSTSPLRFRS